MRDEAEEGVTVENVLREGIWLGLGLHFFLNFLGVLVTRNKVENRGCVGDRVRV